MDLHRRVGLALKTLETRPRPQDVPSLMRAYAKQHFKRSPSGGQGRKRHLGDVSAFLRFAVTRAGAPARSNDLTPPVKPEQLAGLLDRLHQDKKDEL